jgi:hypothetical protein
MSSVPVLLAERASGKLVHAELRDVVDEEQIQDCLQRWHPAMQKLLFALQAKGVPPSELPQNARWNWAIKELLGMLGVKPKYRFPMRRHLK